MDEYLLARKVKDVGGRYFHPSLDDLLAAIDSMPWILAAKGREKAEEA